MSNKKSNEPKYDCLACPSFCCSTYEYVGVSVKDMKRLAKSFGITLEKFIKKYTRHDEDAEHEMARLLKRKKDPLLGETCIFLDVKTRRCTVHLERPEVCRTYPTEFNKGQKNRCSHFDLWKVLQKEQGEDALPLVQITFRK